MDWKRYETDMNNYPIGTHLTSYEQLCSTEDVIKSKAKQRKRRIYTVYPERLKLRWLSTESELNSHLMLGCIIITLRIRLHIWVVHISRCMLSFCLCRALSSHVLLLIKFLVSIWFRVDCKVAICRDWNVGCNGAIKAIWSFSKLWWWVMSHNNMASSALHSRSHEVRWGNKLYCTSTKRSLPDSDVIGYVITITGPPYFLLVPISFRCPCHGNEQCSQLFDCLATDTHDI